MGEIAEMIIDGILCEQCGMLVDGEETGYPRLCGFCSGEEIEFPRLRLVPLKYKGKIRSFSRTKR